PSSLSFRTTAQWSQLSLSVVKLCAVQRCPISLIRFTNRGSKLRPHGKIKLGFFPLPIAEAARLRNCLILPAEFSAVDPCVGDGVAFTHLLKNTAAHRYGIEIDA